MFDKMFKKYALSEEKLPKARIEANKARVMQLAGVGDTERAPHIRFKKAVFIPIAAAVAVAATFTASAAGGWSVFDNIFGGDTELYKTHQISSGSYKITENSYKDYDLDVIDIATDGKVFYIALDVTGKNEASPRDMVYPHDLLTDTSSIKLSNFNFKFDDKFLNGYGLGYSLVDEREDSATLLITANIMTPTDISGKGSFKMSSCDGDEAFAVDFNVNKCEKKTLAVNKNIAFPVVEYPEGNSTAGDWKYYDLDCNVSEICVSDLTVEVRYSFTGAADKNSILPDMDKGNIYLLLDDGTRSELEFGGISNVSVGSSNEWRGSRYFNIKRPVELSRIKAFVIGDTEIAIN